MKFFHLADLHIGKRVNEFNLLEDQQYILKQILSLADQHHPDLLLIAGDVYDKAAPAAEAVAVFDDFLTGWAERQIPVLLIAGNHDSPERIDFGGRIMAKSNIFPVGQFRGAPVKQIFQDEYGQIAFWLLPFFKPAQARPFFPGLSIDSYQQAMEAALSPILPLPDCRNVLVAHQFITAAGVSPLRSDSENVTVGGLDNIDASVFAPFDYVALGHIHRRQSIGGPQICYAGSPLKYSFSEARQEKTVALVELKAKGELCQTLLPLQPLHDLRQIQGPLAALLTAAVSPEERLDYIRAILTDREDTADTLALLRGVYPNLMRLDFPQAANPELGELAPEPALADPLALFGQFYLLQQGEEMSPAQTQIISQIFRELEEEAQ